ncbi:MAG: hypothetical protein ACRDQ0_10540 [Pseudonocardia sp.]
MATPEPHRDLPGAPNPGMHIPGQRRYPPTPEQLAAQASRNPDGNEDESRGEWLVAAVALAVAVAAFILIGAGGAETADEPQDPGPAPTRIR